MSRQGSTTKAPRPAGVLVTGHHGFVGRHALAHWPQAVGLGGAADRIDIRDKAALVRHFGEDPPRLVVHLAALSFVPDSFRDPERTFEVNFLGTLRLLEALADRLDR